MLQGTHEGASWPQDSAPVQPEQPAACEYPQRHLASQEQHPAQQSEGAVQGDTTSLARPTVPNTAECVPSGHHVRPASQAAASMEACQGLSTPVMLHTPGTPTAVGLQGMPYCKMPINIVPRGPKRNLKYWKTVPNGLPEGSQDTV